MEKTWTSELPDHGKVIVIKGPQVGEIWCRFDIWFFLVLYLEGVSCLRLSFFFFFLISTMGITLATGGLRFVRLLCKQ